MTAHPRAALSARHSLKGATLAERRSRIDGVLGLDTSRREAHSLASRLGGHITGLLRVGAVSHRRFSVGAVGRAWV